MATTAPTRCGSSRRYVEFHGRGPLSSSLGVEQHRARLGGATQQAQLLNGFSTTLVYTGVNRGYKPYDNYGNPNLDPEEADTFNVGARVEVGGFKGSLDYWSFKFENPIGTEGGTELVAVLRRKPRRSKFRTR